MSRYCLSVLSALLLVGGCASPKSYDGDEGGGGGGSGGRYRTLASPPADAPTASGSSHWRRRPQRLETRESITVERASRRQRALASPSPTVASGGAGSESSGDSAGQSEQSAGLKGAPDPGSATPADPAAGKGEGDASHAVTGDAKATMARLVIYRGQVVLQVIQLNEAIEAAQKLAFGMGAYLQSRHNNQLVFRVPVEKFQPLVKALEEIGEVAGKSIHAEDVTQQFYDIEVRLKAAEVVLVRLQKLLAQAKNVEESIAIEREMARVMESIERFKGTLRYLRHHASLSTLTIVFQVRPPHGEPIQSKWRTPFGWVRNLGLWRMMSH